MLHVAIVQSAGGGAPETVSARCPMSLWAGMARGTYVRQGMPSAAASRAHASGVDGAYVFVPLGKTDALRLARNAYAIPFSFFTPFLPFRPFFSFILSLVVFILFPTFVIVLPFSFLHIILFPLPHQPTSYFCRCLSEGCRGLHVLSFFLSHLLLISYLSPPANYFSFPLFTYRSMLPCGFSTWCVLEERVSVTSQFAGQPPRRPDHCYQVIPFQDKKCFKF